MSKLLKVIEVERDHQGRMRGAWDWVRRSFRLGPVSLKDPLIAEKLGWSTANASSGVSVTESSALTIAAVWACVRVISEAVSSLPLLLYRVRSDGGRERATNHRLYELLHAAPNPEMTSMVFRETLQAHLLISGNAFAEIERNGAGAPVALWPLPPDRVYPIRQGQTLRYEVINRDGRPTKIDAVNMLHVPGLGYNGTYGYSVIAMARESLGLGLAAERFGSTFFGNGTTFGGYLEHPETLGEDARQNLRESLESKHQGPSRAHRIMLLEEGMKFKESSGIPPNDAQFLETRIFQAQEVCRWFRVPPHKIAELSRSTFSNIEQQSIEFVTDTLRPWLIRWEQEINRKLLSRSERGSLYVEHLVDALLRGDSTARAAYYGAMVQNGIYSIDDVRRLENMNPIGSERGGDVHWVPLNLAPSDQRPAPSQLQPSTAAPRALAIDLRVADPRELRTRRKERQRRERENRQARIQRSKTRQSRQDRVMDEIALSDARERAKRARAQWEYAITARAQARARAKLTQNTDVA